MSTTDDTSQNPGEGRVSITHDGHGDVQSFGPVETLRVLPQMIDAAIGSMTGGKLDVERHVELVQEYASQPFQLIVTTDRDADGSVSAAFTRLGDGPVLGPLVFTLDHLQRNASR